MGKLLTNCLSLFDHFLGFSLKELDSWVHWPNLVYCTHVEIFFCHTQYEVELSIIAFWWNKRFYFFIFYLKKQLISNLKMAISELFLKSPGNYSWRRSYLVKLKSNIRPVNFLFFLEQVETKYFGVMSKNDLTKLPQPHCWHSVYIFPISLKNPEFYLFWAFTWWQNIRTADTSIMWSLTEDSYSFVLNSERGSFCCFGDKVTLWS